MEQGTFRKDLYYRLHVVELKVRPLREHSEDIPDLARFFLNRYSRRTGRTVRGFTPDALRALRDYEWPGNIRELQNTIERAVILGMEDQVDLEDLQLSRLGGGATKAGARKTSLGLVPASPKEISLEDLERRHILAILESTDWNKPQAAQILGIERSTLDRKLKQPPKPTQSLLALSETEFASAVRDGLRDFIDLPALQGNPLLQSRLVLHKAGSDSLPPQRLAVLRQMLQDAAAPLQHSPKQAKLYRAL